MRSLFAVLAALAVLLAGCSQGPEATDATTDDPDPAPDDSGEGNMTGAGDGASGADEAGGDAAGAGDTGSAPPERGALLDADAVNGTAPLAVNVTIDALDAGNVTGWSLDWGDGNTTEGDAVPATANHTLGAGNFTLDLTVAYVDDDEANASLVISVTGGARDPVVDEYTAALTGSVPYLPVSGDMPSQADFVWTSHENDAPWVHAHTVTVPEGATSLQAATALLDATAEHPVGLLCGEGDPVAPDSDLFLFQADGTFLTSSGNCGTGEAVAAADPAPGDYVIVNWAFLGSSMDVPTTVTISFA